jgi:thioredoxin-like negative regulator of GroEL
VTGATFSEVLAAHPVVVVHFWAAWNQTDRAMDALLQRVRPEFANRIEFRSCDIDDLDSVPIISKARVLNIPTLACFIRGRHHETRVGLRSEQDLGTKLASWSEPAASEIIPGSSSLRNERRVSEIFRSKFLRIVGRAHLPKIKKIQ